MHLLTHEFQLEPRLILNLLYMSDVLQSITVCVKRTAVDRCLLKATDANYKLHSCAQLV